MGAFLSVHSSWRKHLRNLLVFTSPLLLLVLFAPTRVQLATAPVLITKTNSTPAIAVESTNLVAEPFALTAPVTFGQDNRTRVILFADNLTLQPGDTFSAVTADAEDVNHIHYPLTVEYVGSVPSFPFMT